MGKIISFVSRAMATFFLRFLVGAKPKE